MEVLGIIVAAIVGSGLVLTLLLQLRKLLKKYAAKTPWKLDDALVGLVDDEDLEKVAKLIESSVLQFIKDKKKEEDKPEG